MEKAGPGPRQLQGAVWPEIMTFSTLLGSEGQAGPSPLSHHLQPMIPQWDPEPS